MTMELDRIGRLVGQEGAYYSTRLVRGRGRIHGRMRSGLSTTHWRSGSSDERGMARVIGALQEVILPKR